MDPLAHAAAAPRSCGQDCAEPCRLGVPRSAPATLQYDPLYDQHLQPFSLANPVLSLPSPPQQPWAPPPWQEDHSGGLPLEPAGSGCSELNFADLLDGPALQELDYLQVDPDFVCDSPSQVQCCFHPSSIRYISPVEAEAMQLAVGTQTCGREQRERLPAPLSHSKCLTGRGLAARLQECAGPISGDCRERRASAGKEARQGTAASI